MHELFDAIGQPRNYDLSDRQRQESRKDEKQMGKIGLEKQSLREERQGEEKKRRAKNSEEWVGSTAAHSVQNQCGAVRQMERSATAHFFERQTAAKRNFFAGRVNELEGV